MAIIEEPKKSTSIIPYIIIIAAILTVGWFSVYPNFIKTPDISVAQPIAKAVVKKGELTKLIDDLFRNSQFTKLEQHGELLPTLPKERPTLEEIRQTGPVGRPNPFTPASSVVPGLSE